MLYEVDSLSEGAVVAIDGDQLLPQSTLHNYRNFFIVVYFTTVIFIHRHRCF
jgi:hypothetical protein